jgi:hypothetical protein
MILSQPSLHQQLLKAVRWSSPVATMTAHQALAANLSSLPPSCCNTSISRRSFTSSQQRARRRKRPTYGIAKMEGTGPPKQFVQLGLDAPYAYGGKDGTNTEEYLEKTSLSPWVPIPDVVARKLFDMSEAGPEDVSEKVPTSWPLYMQLLLSTRRVAISNNFAVSACLDSCRLGMWRWKSQFSCD